MEMGFDTQAKSCKVACSKYPSQQKLIAQYPTSGRLWYKIALNKLNKTMSCACLVKKVWQVGVEKIREYDFSCLDSRSM